MPRPRPFACLILAALALAACKDRGRGCSKRGGMTAARAGCCS